MLENVRSKKVVTNTRRRESQLRTKKNSWNVKQFEKCNKVFYSERCKEGYKFVDNDCDSSLGREFNAGDEQVKTRKVIHKVYVEKETESNGNLTQYDSEDHSVLEFPKPKYVRRKKTEVVAEHFCDICAKGFTRKFDMLKHRTKAHQNAPEPPKTTYKKNSELILRCQITGPDGMKGYKCETCGKIIRFIYNFIRHQSSHTGARPYFCHMCGKSYPILSTLTRHIREHHQRVKKFSCEICDKKFVAKAALEEHKNIHTNERPFVCDACGKSFKQKSSLHIHKIFHSNVFRFSCSMCGKKFRRSRDLKVHSWLHTGHRPYACKICGSMFRLSQDLKRHTKVHNKVLIQSSCTECGAIFNHQKQLMNHMKIHQVQIQDQKSEVKPT